MIDGYKFEEEEDQHSRDSHSDCDLEKAVVGVRDGSVIAGLILDKLLYEARGYAEEEAIRRRGEDLDACSPDLCSAGSAACYVSGDALLNLLFFSSLLSVLDAFGKDVGHALAVFFLLSYGCLGFRTIILCCCLIFGTISICCFLRSSIIAFCRRIRI